jgi:hypothetical protein
MPDQIVFPALALIAAALVALALVWPQGQGAPSPAPFGHPTSALEQIVAGSGGSATVIRGSQGEDAAVQWPGEPRRPARP